MKQLLNLLPFLAILCVLGSCTKSDLIAPAVTEQSVISNEIQTDTLTAAEPVPGVYKIIRFIDDGKDETAQFAGYFF